MSSEIRLQKYIADCGITSRRKAEDLIVQGRVTLNGSIITELGTKVNPESDAVAVDGKMADFKAVDQMYIMMNKPRGYMSTLSDPEGRDTIMDLCREVSERIYPVGRLDYLSEGLLLLTNDGKFANAVMHPSSNIVKVYEVKVFGQVTSKILKQLRLGVQLPEGFVKPLSVRIIKQLPTKTWLEFRLSDGKNREIRKICESSGIIVDKLKRLAIGNLSVEGIAPGKFHFCSRNQLLKALGLNSDLSINTTNAKKYQSEKKSISLKDKAARKGTSAADERFQKFKKETYFDSLTAIATSKKLAKSKVVAKRFEEREEAHKRRKDNKRKRVFKKTLAEKAPHAILVKD